MEKWWVCVVLFDNLEFNDFEPQCISSQVVVIGPCGDMLGAYYDLKYVV